MFDKFKSAFVVRARKWDLFKFLVLGGAIICALNYPMHFFGYKFNFKKRKLHDLFIYICQI